MKNYYYLLIQNSDILNLINKLNKLFKNFLTEKKIHYIMVWRN